MIDFKTTSTEYHFMFFFKRVCWTLELSYCWVSSFIERSTSSSNREEFIHSAHSKLYLASLFKLNFSSVSSPNRSPLFVEEFKWEDLKVLQILPFCTAEASSKYSMTSIVLLNYKVLNTPPPEKKKPRLDTTGSRDFKSQIDFIKIKSLVIPFLMLCRVTQIFLLVKSFQCYAAKKA